MKKDFIGTLHMGAVILWLLTSVVFWAIAEMPRTDFTRPIITWAFRCRRACEKKAQRQYIRTALIAKSNIKIDE